MRKQFSLTPLLYAILAFFAGTSAHAQSAYSNAVVSLVPPPAAYWPLQESVQPPAYIATNLGTIGSAGNGYYMSWFTATNNSSVLILTNNINHTNGATADGDSGYGIFGCDRAICGLSPQQP